jgi:putative ABC transporter-associated repeat protein
VLVLVIIGQQMVQAGERVVIAEGHIDAVAPRIVDGLWTVQIRDATGASDIWRDPGDVVLHVVEAARLIVPSDPSYRFLGAAGADVWVMPQIQKQGILWPGWNTQDSSVLNEIRGGVTWTLRSVDGPGEFALFVSGSFGESTVLFSSGQSLPQKLEIPPNTHAHANWAFTSPGTYRLAIELSATSTGGQALSDFKTLTIAVGNVDPLASFEVPAQASPGAMPAAPQASGSSDSVPVPIIAGGAICLILAFGLVAMLWRRKGTD